MEERKGKYLESMVQRAMEEEKSSGDRRQYEFQRNEETGFRTGSVGEETHSLTGSVGEEAHSRTGNARAVGTRSATGSFQNASGGDQEAKTKARPGSSNGRDNNSGNSGGKGKNSFFRGLISGTVISDSFILKDIRYSAMIVVLAIVFIANRFNAERTEREISALEQEVSDLRAEALSVSADLGSVSRQSEITDLVKERGLGLEELREPPYRIVVNE